MKTIRHKIPAYLFLLLASATWSSCVKDTTPPNPNEEELITTLQVRWTDSAGVQPAVVATYRDLDGDGGNAPSTWDSITLKANTTYLGSILLLDESKVPVDTISEEVREEAADHLFCFGISGVSCTIKATDVDLNGLPLGLQTTWRTGAPATGNVTITLRHQPGTKNGSCTPGATDLEIPFQLRIE